MVTDGGRERKFTEPLGADKSWRRKNSLNHLSAHRSYAQCTAVCRRCKLPRTCRCSVDQNGVQGQWKLF